MSRREQLAAVQSAEASLVARRQTLRAHRLARIEAMRRVHPALLLAGGVLAGLTTDRIAARLYRSGSLLPALRLLGRIPGGALATLLGPDA